MSHPNVLQFGEAADAADWLKYSSDAIEIGHLARALVNALERIARLEVQVQKLSSPEPEPDPAERSE